MFSLYNKSVSVPVIVQPDTDQDCLLGINAIPLLGISILHGGGKPVAPSSPVEQERATVNMMRSVTVPTHSFFVY